MSRRRRGGPGIVVILWRDIPAQITTTTADGTTAKVLLDQRFQVAIDRAATIAGLTEADDYVSEWRRTSPEFDGDVLEAARTIADDIDRQYSKERIEDLIANGGLDPASNGDPEP